MDVRRLNLGVILRSCSLVELLVCGSLLSALPGLSQNSSITGLVTNKTTNRPSAGDDVVLIRLQQGMQEATRTKTDAKGRYKLDVPDGELHLVRVTHDKANYFKPAQPGTQTLDLEVYNAAAKVAGVTQEADVMRLQTDASGSGLRVVENFFVKNDSSPPTTQFSDRPFEFYLPAGAVVEGSAALAPNGMPVQSPPVPLGDPNHYAFIFPVRPGETRFQVTYTVPYKGSLLIAPRPVMPTDTIAVMMPKSMTFKGGTSTPYNAVADEVNAQTYVARNVQPSQPLDFTVGGTGQLPRDTQTGQSSSQNSGQTSGPDTAGGGNPTPDQASEQMRSDTKPGRGLGNPLDSEGNLDPWAKYKWWTIGGLGLLLAIAAGVMLRGPAGAKRTGVSGDLLQVLRDEMFSVETDRLEGRLNPKQYAEIKGALEVVLKRALTRSGSVVDVTETAAP